MNEFYQGLIAGLGMLGGLCAFNYWMFQLLEKRLDGKLDIFSSKIDLLSDDVHSIMQELKEDRRNKDRMYQFVLDSHLAHEAKADKRKKGSKSDA